MIVRPASDDRVEVHDQVSGGDMLARLDDPPDFLQERRDILP